MNKNNEQVYRWVAVLFASCGVGLLAASIAVALYRPYSALWSFTQDAVSVSMLIFLPLSLISIGVPYALVKRFANTKTTGSGNHTVLEAYHLTNGEVGLKDSIVKPTAAILTIGSGEALDPKASLLAGGGVAAALSRRSRRQFGFWAKTNWKL